MLRKKGYLIHFFLVNRCLQICITRCNLAAILIVCVVAYPTTLVWDDPQHQLSAFNNYTIPETYNWFTKNHVHGKQLIPVDGVKLTLPHQRRWVAQDNRRVPFIKALSGAGLREHPQLNTNGRPINVVEV